MKFFLKRIKKELIAIKLIRKPKIFVISFQRTGTTSTGRFLSDHNYRVATYSISKRNNWTLKWFKGDFEKYLIL